MSRTVCEHGLQNSSVEEQQRCLSLVVAAVLRQDMASVTFPLHVCKHQGHLTGPIHPRLFSYLEKSSSQELRRELEHNHTH